MKIACISTLLLLVGIAHAHKIKIFAMVNGNTISGYAYASGGTRIANSKINIYAPPTKLIGSSKTNADGEFSFPIRLKAAYRLVLKPGDGHVAEYTVSAAEVGNLPKAQSQPQATPSAITPTVATTSSSNDLAPVMAQVQALRAEVEQYEDKIRVHDILGGIGFIMGIMGIILYFKAKPASR